MMIAAGALVQALKSGSAELSAKCSVRRVDKGFDEAMALDNHRLNEPLLTSQLRSAPLPAVVRARRQLPSRR